jgi:acetyl-CoA acetyltransferase
VNGGAIALTHPLARRARASRRTCCTSCGTAARYGLGAACIGGGQGMAVVVENLQA